jgi:5-methylcytosine-specific restriction protein A
MPRRPKSICRQRGCGALIDVPGFCEKHRQDRQRDQDDRRGTAFERGYDSKWQRARARFLREHPLCQCVDCAKLVVPLPASVVDHKIPHRLKEAKDSGDAERIRRALELFWNRSNWQALAKPCHDRKTAREDGGFGRRRLAEG